MGTSFSVLYEKFIEGPAAIRQWPAGEAFEVPPDPQGFKYAMQPFVLFAMTGRDLERVQAMVDAGWLSMPAGKMDKLVYDLITTDWVEALEAVADIHRLGAGYMHAAGHYNALKCLQYLCETVGVPVNYLHFAGAIQKKREEAFDYMLGKYNPAVGIYFLLAQAHSWNHAWNKVLSMRKKKEMYPLLLSQLDKLDRVPDKAFLEDLVTWEPRIWQEMQMRGLVPATAAAEPVPEPV